MKKLFLYLIFLFPLIYALIRIFIFDDLNDPIKYIYTFTGVSATIILFFSITISMIRNKINLMKYRRDIGLLGFLYAFLHILNFIVLDAQFDFSFVLKETIDKPFIYLGVIGFFIVLFMAITSTKKLFRKYNNYHKLIYISLLLITIHWVMAQKSLNIYQIIYLVIIIVLAYYKFHQKIIRKINN